jgi:nucleotide-binding universal stress UspA family protein
LQEKAVYQRILVPIDGSPTSDKALTTAIQMAQAFGARLRLIHVMEETAYLTGYDPFGGYAGDLIRIMRESGEKILEEGMKAVQAAGVAVDTMLIDELGQRLGEAVANGAKLWNADLIVVGTHGRRGVGRLLMGSGAEQIIRQAPMPVLVVRSPEAES